MEKIIKRCFWCKPKHLMDENGEFIVGEIVPGKAYSDGICNAAMPEAREESRQIIEARRVKDLLSRLKGE